MNKLTQAILQGDLAKVTYLLEYESQLFVRKTKLGDSPINLAKKKGTKKIEARIVVETNSLGEYKENELKVLLVDLISELTQDKFCASWISKVPFEIWDLLEGGADHKTLEKWCLPEDMDSLKDIKRLMNLTQSWAIWDEKVGGPVPIEIQVWKQIVKERRQN